MAQFFGYETITSLYRYSTTQVRLPGGFTLKVAGQGYSSATEVVCDISVSGKGGIDTGTVAAGKVYYVYAVYSSGTFGLVASLSSTSPTGFTTYKKVGVFSTNSISQINTTVYDYNALNSESVLNTKGYLRNNTLLSTSDFPDTTGLYVWPINGNGSFSGLRTYGSTAVDLAQTGAITGSTNHLGSSVYNDFDGTNDAMYAPGTDFDAVNESFTVGGWYKITAAGGDNTLASKLVSANADRSFLFKVTNTGTVLELAVYYNASGGTNTIRVPSDTIKDGRWHHIVAVYDKQSSYGTLTIIIDGKIVGFEYSSNLSARNNTANSKLTFGAFGNGGSPSQTFNGQMADVFYKKSAMTFDQVRQLYVVGTKLQAYLDLTSKVKINGETGPYGWYEQRGLSATSTSSTYVAAATWRLPIAGTYDFLAWSGMNSNYNNNGGSNWGGNLRITFGGTSIGNADEFWYDAGNTFTPSYMRCNMSVAAKAYPVSVLSNDLVLEVNSYNAASNHLNNSGVFRWELWNY